MQKLLLVSLLLMIKIYLATDYLCLLATDPKQNNRKYNEHLLISYSHSSVWIVGYLNLLNILTGKILSYPSYLYNTIIDFVHEYGYTTYIYN